MTRKLNRRKAAPVAIAAAAALMLSGCGGQSPTNAVTVDGQSLSVKDVQEATAELKKVSPQASADVIVELFVINSVLEPLAAEKGIVINNQQIRQVLAFDAGITDPPPALVDAFATNTLIQQVQQSPEGADIVAELQEKLGQVKAQVNPRYGSWDGNAPGLDREPSPWIEMNKDAENQQPGQPEQPQQQPGQQPGQPGQQPGQPGQPGQEPTQPPAQGPTG